MLNFVMSVKIIIDMQFLPNHQSAGPPKYKFLCFMVLAVRMFPPPCTILLIVCSAEDWQKILSGLGCDSIQLRDARYDQVVHMMTAANGAEQFYQLANNATRSEGLELARELDTKAAQVCVINIRLCTVFVRKI